MRRCFVATAERQNNNSNNNLTLCITSFCMAVWRLPTAQTDDRSHFFCIFLSIFSRPQ